MKQYILVVGSSNTDMVVKADHLPSPGETILGGTFLMNPGGKGANQAVAAARLGGGVTFICKTGDDIFGRQAIQSFENEGIDISCLFSDSQHPSGVALITVDKNAENCIVVASGANAALSVADLQTNKTVIQGANIVLMQLEIPLSTVAYVAEVASQTGNTVILNPAPACKLPDALYQHITILTPNQHEAQLLTGIQVVDVDSAKMAATLLTEKGVKNVIITLGKDGALVYSNLQFTHIAAEKVVAVDTTAAGDVFNGALAVAIAEGSSIEEATIFACKAAAIAVTRLGAQSSAPYRHEINIPLSSNLIFN